jgi:regulator of sigma E protease
MDMLDQLLKTPFDFLKNYGGPFVIVLSILVFVHEWGHYIVARMCGVKVEKFSIGFGPELFGRNDKNGTRWKFCLIPLGGYVQMFGDTDPASAGHTDGVKDGEQMRPFTAEEKKVAFFSQPVGRRAAIVFAGPAINYIFAILLLAGLYMFQGQPYTPAIAASVLEGSPAERAGIRPDDKIISLNGQKIVNFQDLKKFVLVNLNAEIDVEVASLVKKDVWSEKTRTIKLVPDLVFEEDRFGFKHSTGRIGLVSPKGAFATQEHTPVSAVTAAVAEVWTISVNTLQAIGQMIMGTRSSDELGGILRIGAYAGDFAQQGLIAFITFTALLSVNLGLVNLLPIPMLDGGHLAMFAMEKASGKPLNERAQEYALRVGLTFILAIMVLATWNDLVQLKVVDYVVKMVS